MPSHETIYASECPHCICGWVRGADGKVRRCARCGGDGWIRVERDTGQAEVEREARKLLEREGVG